MATLVAAIPEVLLVNEGVDPQAAGDGDGGIAAGIVNQKHLVDDVARDLAIRLLERAFGLECRQDHNDFLAVQHGVRPSGRRYVVPRSGAVGV